MVGTFCEGYINGIFTLKDYKDILTMWDVYSVTVLGIEMPTHTPRQAVTITSSVQYTSSGKVTTTQSINPPATEAAAPATKDATQHQRKSRCSNCK